MFQDICNGKITGELLTVMRDVAIAKSEFKAGEQAITKLQEFQNVRELFEYCEDPQVELRNFFHDFKLCCLLNEIRVHV